MSIEPFPVSMIFGRIGTVGYAMMFDMYLCYVMCSFIYEMHKVLSPMTYQTQQWFNHFMAYLTVFIVVLVFPAVLVLLFYYSSCEVLVSFGVIVIDHYNVLTVVCIISWLR